MPELPEVETVRKGLESSLTGATIRKVTLRRKNLRIPFPPGFAKALEGHTILAVHRRAKYLLFELDSGKTVLAHLGMSGRFSVEPKAPKALATHDHVVWELADGRVVLYNDARRFGLMTLTDTTSAGQHKLLAELGPEPLGKDFSAAYLADMLARHSTPVKTTIMDQKLVVGVGNIYASEALFLAGIDPRKPAKKATDKAPALNKAIREVLQDAIKSGGSSLRDFLHVSGEAGYFQHHFNVYGRKGEPCVRCHSPIQILKQSGRSTFFCRQCQS